MKPSRRELIGTLAAPLLLRGQGSASRNIQATPRSKPSGLPFYAHFTDIGQQAGLRYPAIYGPPDHKDYIIETIGCGCAFFDYDNDGWMDVLVLSGLRATGTNQDVSSRLYKNNRDGTFTDVTEKAGLLHKLWASAVTVGDYNNDGFEDLFITAYGQNVLYRNNGNGSFTDVTKETASQLRMEIVSPNQPGEHIGRGWGIPSPATVIAKTKSGSEYRGVLKGLDSFSVQMIDTAGCFHSFEKAQLVDLIIEPKSLMPSDFGKSLTKAEIQNLVAYLKTLDGSASSKLPLDEGLTWDRILHSEREPQNSLMYWGDLGGKRFSALNQINTGNVNRLQAKWALQLPGDGIVESVPLVVDGIMYTTGPVGGTGQVLALDAKTGQVIWRYERKQKITNPYEINRVSRGVSILGNRLFFGTLDSALVALDVRTGAPLWETQVADAKLGYSITSPPLVVKDKVITGVSGGEFGVRGFIDAYDALTGKRLWRWYTVPGKGEFGNDTWAGDSWKHGGAPTWLTGSYDPELNLLYWPTGNPGPDLNGDVRKGDNLFSCSVVALDPDTGQRKWHYQFTPNDTHDWDATEDLVLVDRMWRGQQRKLLLHADRNGVFYILDRSSGKLLSASPFVRATWVKGWDASGRPITAENWRADPEGTTVYPALGGGTNFQSPSYSPQTGWMYLMYYDGPGRYTSGPAPYEPGRMYQGSGSSDWSLPHVEGQAPPSTGVMAFDPETGKAQWRFELVEGSLQPGLLSTAGGLVLTASPEGNFIALDANTGKALWKFGAGATIPSSPVTYSVDGKQYVAVSSANVLYSFGLPD